MKSQHIMRIGLPLLLAGLAQSLSGQSDVGAGGPTANSHEFTAAQLSHAMAAQEAMKATGFHIVVSLDARRLWVIDRGGDTLLDTPVAIGKGTTLHRGDETWTFTTPLGVRTVLSKQADPLWVPPAWLYAEVANEYHLKVSTLVPGRPVTLKDGRRLVVKDSAVGLVDRDGEFDALPENEHIIFDNTLFVPPVETRNRHVVGALGKFRLALGDGYFIHGTPDESSIGFAATHGCIRVGDAYMQWLFDLVPVGTKVYIY